MSEKKMSPRQFVYWLQGFFEISEAESVNEEQTQIIKNKLDKVFVHAEESNKETVKNTPSSKLEVLC